MKMAEVKGVSCMGWICPECGLINKGEASECGCGFQSVFLISEPSDFVPGQEEGAGNEAFDIDLSMRNIFPEGGADPAPPEKTDVEELPLKRDIRTPDEAPLKRSGHGSFLFRLPRAKSP